jgi:hypothetical protein
VGQGTYSVMNARISSTIPPLRRFNAQNGLSSENGNERSISFPWSTAQILHLPLTPPPRPSHSLHKLAKVAPSGDISNCSCWTTGYPEPGKYLLHVFYSPIIHPQSHRPKSLPLRLTPCKSLYPNKLHPLYHQHSIRKHVHPRSHRSRHCLWSN